MPAPLRPAYREARQVLARLHGLHRSRLLAAASGGPDSALLVHVLAAAAPRMGFDVVGVHVDHGLTAAAHDLAHHARAACDGAGVPFFAVRVHVQAQGHEGLESAARRARWDALRAAARSHGAAWVCTGHNATDVAETFVQRILEGAGRGQAAMQPVDGTTVRPLVGLTRAQVRRIAGALQLPSVDDPMNDNPAFLRGWMRTRLWPILVERFPSADLTLARAAGLAAADRDALDALSLDVKTEHARAALARLPEALRLRALRGMVEAARGGPLRTGAEAVRRASSAVVARGGPTRRFKVGDTWLVVGTDQVRAQRAAAGDRAAPSA